MLTLAIGDKLMIRQHTQNILKPWSFQLIEKFSDTVIDGNANITSNYIIINLTDEDFSAYIGKTIYCSIRYMGIEIAQDKFLLRNLYNEFPKVKTIAGLLGENQQREIETPATMYQDGHMLENKLTLSDTGQEFSWKREYLSEFKPDKRFFQALEYQKESE